MIDKKESEMTTVSDVVYCLKYLLNWHYASLQHVA